jgi:hypothetical protein
VSYIKYFVLFQFLFVKHLKYKRFGIKPNFLCFVFVLMWHIILNLYLILINNNWCLICFK